MLSPHLGRVHAIERSLSADSASAYVRRHETLRLTGAPPLLTLNHFALSSGVDWGFLRRVINRSAPAYRAIKIPKRKGGFRDLQSPSEELMRAQQWLLRNVLSVVPRHPNNFAYFPGVTTRQCVERHAGARWMIKTDLHNYFPSISERQVFTVFASLGYSELLSFELARICTWPLPSSTKPNREQGRLPYLRLGLGALPQGAPTSGALANASTTRLDANLTRFAAQESLVYTRYSDDMSFSSADEFDRARAAELVTQVRRIVTASGLALHQRKTRVIPPGARKVLLGMQITETGVGILPEHRRRVDLYIHSVERYGPVDFARVRRFESPLSLINHVEGWLAYLHHLDPVWTKSRFERWAQALAVHHVFSTSLA